MPAHWRPRTCAHGPNAGTRSASEPSARDTSNSQLPCSLPKNKRPLGLLARPREPVDIESERDNYPRLLRMKMPLLFRVSAMALAGPIAAPAAVDFIKDVQPILEISCVRCHNP